LFTLHDAELITPEVLVPYTFNSYMFSLSTRLIAQRCIFWACASCI